MSTADASPALPRPDSSDRILRIERSSHWASLDLRELWAYRELLFFLTWRDVKTSYNQMVLGIVWAILKPLLSMVVFAVIFGGLAGIKGEYGVPYPLWVFTGLLPWTYFAACLAQSSGSIVGSSGLITKVYFPRLVVPIASVVSPLIDFMFAFVILIAMFVYFGRVPHWHAIAIPFFFLWRCSRRSEPVSGFLRSTFAITMSATSFLSVRSSGSS